MNHFLPSLLILLAGASALAERIGGPTDTDGTAVTCDLPHSEWIKNVGGRDGSGLCVYTSVEMCGRYQNAEALRGFQDKMRSELGGGYPSKLDKMLAKYVPGLEYIQYEGGDSAILDLAMKTGRPVAVTYGYSPRYGSRIAHMTCLIHLDQKVACILDCNFVQPNQLEWVARDEFLRRWKMMGGGWAVVILKAPPPPIPIN